MNIKKIIIGSILMLSISLGNFGINHHFLSNQDSSIVLTADAQPVIDGEEYAKQLAANASSTNKSLNDLAALLDIILNTMYIIIWPLLAITGMALDNSLVYGEAFGLTSTLRKFWTIMMQISFMILTFMILRDIIKMVLNKDGNIYKDLPKKVKSWLLAGIFIPLSRFIVSALIDLSTILIYQVGTIPLTLIKNNDNTKILINSSIINLADRAPSTSQKETNFRFNSTYSCSSDNKKTYLPCLIESSKFKEESWNKYVQEEKTKYASNTNQNMGISIENGKGFCALSPTSLLKVDFNIDISSKTGLAELIKQGNEEMAACSTVGDLISKSKSMVGPLYAIYGSLLNFTSLNVTVSAQSTETEIMLFLIKAATGMLLIIPLIVLAFVSIARIGILWMVIAFSPLLVLNKIFKGEGASGDLSKNLESNWMGVVNFKTGVDEIIEIIFQPVIVVLALGLSIVFLNATTNMLKYGSDKAGLLDAIGIDIDNDGEYQTFTVNNEGGKTTDIKIKKFSGEYSTSIFFDYFSWIIANIFGIMIMWKMMFMALGAAKMTKELTNKMETFGEDYLSSRAIFPGPNGALSRDSVKQITDIDRGIPGEIIKKLSKDKTEDDAKNLVSSVKARLPGSEEEGKHNKQFALDKKFDAEGADQNQMAADKMAEGIVNMGNGNKNYHYLNKKDTGSWDRMTGENALNVTGDDLSELVTQENFWKSMGKSKNSENVISILNEAQSKDDVAAGLVGSKKVEDLRANLKSGIQKLRSGDISSVDKNKNIKYYGDEILFTKTTADEKNKTYTIEKAFTIDKINIKDSRNIVEINEFVKGNQAMYDAVKTKLEIKDLDENTENGGVYSNDNKFAINNPKPVVPDAD